jgi:hypothetical protein
VYDVLHDELSAEPDLLQRLLDALSDVLDGRVSTGRRRAA